MGQVILNLTQVTFDGDRGPSEGFYSGHHAVSTCGTVLGTLLVLIKGS